MIYFKKILVLVCFLSTVFLFNCETEFFMNCLSGNSDSETRTIVLETDITGIVLFPDTDLILKEGDEQSIEITASAKFLDALETDSKIENGVYKMDVDACVNNVTINMVATVPNLSSLSIEGNGTIKTEGVYTSHAQSLSVTIDGDGDIQMDLGSLTEFLFEVSGDGDLDQISGNVENFYIDISGDGKVNAFDFKAKQCEINISGTGDCQVAAETNLSIKINGDGDVCYQGDPNIEQNISGTGQVRSCN